MASLSPDAISGLLLTTHAMLAKLTQTPELELEEPDCDVLAKATVTLMEQYPNVPFSPKMAAWLVLGSTVGTVYGPRFGLMMLRLKAERAAAARSAAPGTITVLEV